MNPVLSHSSFLFPPSIKLYLPGLFICIRFSSLCSRMESPLDDNTLLTNSTDVPPFCPHFVCKLILEGWGERSLVLSTSACFPHFVLTCFASFDRWTLSILAILHSRRVCLTPQMAPYRFFHSCLCFLCGVWHLWWWQSAQGLLYSGKQLSKMEGTHRELLFNTVPVLPKPIHASHRPLPHSQDPSLSFQFSCVLPATLRALMFMQHTHSMNTHTLQSLSLASGKTSQSARRQLTVSTIHPLNLGICTADLALYHSSQASTIFLLTNHTLKISAVLNALPKGHDIQKWHSLWGDGLDVGPINKVSSISSVSELLGGLFLILKAFHPTLSRVTAPPEVKLR